MRDFFGRFSFASWLILAPSMVMADMETLSVTISYRERIALPPGAELGVQIFDVAGPEEKATQVTSQRFVMTGVPMTVSLTYDPQIIAGGSRYAAVAAILTPDGQPLFRGVEMLDVLDNSDLATVDLVLTMMSEADSASAVPRSIAGVPWTVTEVFGEAWNNDDPATLVIDNELNFSIFGGCNRFSGQLVFSGEGLSFPEDFAATMMACPDEVEMLEGRFLAALRQVVDYVRYGAGLVMTDAAGRAVLHFVETPE